MKANKNYFDYAVIAVIALAILAFSVTSGARDKPQRPYLVIPQPGAPTFYAFAKDTVLTESFKLVTSGSFTHLIVADTLRLYSDTAGDSSYAMIYYAINDTLFSREFRLKGTDTTFTNIKPTYFEVAALDSPAIGKVTIQGKTRGPIAIVVPGRVSTAAAHHYFGGRGGALYSWSAAIDSTTDARTDMGIRFELRRYNTYNDGIRGLKYNKDAGYEVLDAVTLSLNMTGNRRTGPIPLGDPATGKVLFMPAKSYVGVWATNTLGTTTGVSTHRVFASISGEDR